jgi:hypothetical protein
MQHYLQVREASLIFFVSVLLIENNQSYLIISCDENGNCIESPSSGEFTRANHRLRSQLLLAVRFHTLGLDNAWWSRPVIDWYLSFFAPLLVDIIMLTNMEAI